MLPKIVMTGTGCLSDFAQNQSALIDNLAQKNFVELQSVFENNMMKNLFGFEHDIKYAPLRRPRKDALKKYSDIDNDKVAALINVTEQVLSDANLDENTLSLPSTHVFWGSSGHQPELFSFFKELHSNESIDLLLNKKVNQLHADSFRNDTLTHSYSEYFNLANPILTISSACSSALNAMVPAIAMLQSGQIDRALVLSWQEVSKFDILFMSGLNILAKKQSLPFSKDSDGLTPAYGVGGILLERQDTAQHDRGHFIIKAMSSRRALSGSAHSPSMNVSFRPIVQTIQDVLDKANVTCEEVDLVYPHGNGIGASDQAEIAALSQLFSQHNTKIVSYTEQTGYLLSASGCFDLLIASDVFKNDRIIAMQSKGNLELTKGMNFVLETCQNHVRYLLKNSIGIDGSIVSCLLERVNHD